jgi:RNA polymerase sigma factor (TIGR02999 family)
MQLLGKVRAGDRAAFDQLVEVVYNDLRDLAHIQRRRWAGDETLNTTAILHETYLKLAAQEAPDWKSGAHFRSVAARAMRQVLIDHSRARRTAKRAGDRVRVPLDELRVAGPDRELSDEQAEALIALDRSLEELSRVHERQGRIVECRFFGGMTVHDTATALGVSPATVKRGWVVAKAWLYRDIQQQRES